MNENGIKMYFPKRVKIKLLAFFGLLEFGVDRTG